MVRNKEITKVKRLGPTCWTERQINTPEPQWYSGLKLTEKVISADIVLPNRSAMFQSEKSLHFDGCVGIFWRMKKEWKNPPRVHSNIHLWPKTTLAASSQQAQLSVYHQEHDVWNCNNFSTANQSAPKIMTATLGQSPIGWWRMLCGWTAASENTITTSLRLSYRVSAQTSCLCVVDKWTRHGGDECSWGSGSV